MSDNHTWHTCSAKDIGDADWWLGKDKAGKEGMVQRKDFLVIDDGS